MKKKILGMFLVLILVVCLFFIGSGVILMMAPGVELFGIRYIGGGRSVFNKEVTLSDLEGDSIFIETNGIPINITYTTSYTSKVEFSQNFQGFTKTKYDKADLSVYLDEENNTHINTTEMVKWLYSNEDAGKNYLNIQLSRVYAMNKNLYIISNSGKVTINGDATYQDLSVETGATMVVKGSVTANNIKYFSGNSITISQKLNAQNYNLKSTGGSIVVAKEVEGDLVAKTKGGDVKFISCNNLSVVTGGGSVKAYGSGLNSVLKATNIETSGGDVILGNVSTVDESALCNIKSTSGEVHITSMKDGSISSDRGKIEISEARAVVINSKVNAVNVAVIKEQIIVNGRNGNITLGKNGQANNVKVYTTTGKINVENAYGSVELESVSSTVNLKNLGSQKISLIAGRDLTASGLKGDVYLKSNGEIDAKFEGVSGNVEVITGSKTNNVYIDAGKTSYLDVDYNIVSTKGKIAKVYVGDDILDENSNLNTGLHEGKHLIIVKTSYAKVVLKLVV